MVILGGLEIVAAGYLIHKHQQNKKDRARAEEEEAILEEEEYRRRHPRHGHGSHSRRRHSRERRHSYDSKHDYKLESPRPRPARPAMRPQAPHQAPPPSTAQQSMRPPPPPAMVQPSMQAPPPYNAVPTATPQPPQDIKYGWTDEPTPQQQQPPQQDPNFPPTGWPSHWQQSQAPDPGARLQTPYQRGESSRGRGDGRAVSASPRVRFATPRRERSPSFSPPPSYRA